MVDAAESADNKPNAIPQPQPLAAGWAKILWLDHVLHAIHNQQNENIVSFYA